MVLFDHVSLAWMDIFSIAFILLTVQHLPPVSMELANTLFFFLSIINELLLFSRMIQNSLCVWNLFVLSFMLGSCLFEWRGAATMAFSCPHNTPKNML